MSRVAEVIARLDRSGNCWNWLGHRNRNGYGRVGVDGGTQLVHRYIYSELVGEIRPGMEIDHLCRNRACANPGHLEQVTHAENMRRMDRKLARYCRRGHEMAPENTYVWTSQRRTERHCRQCRSVAAQLRAVTK